MARPAGRRFPPRSLGQRTRIRLRTGCRGTGCPMGGAGFEPAKALPSDLQSDPFGRSGNPPVNSACRSSDSLAGCTGTRRPASPRPRSVGPRRSQRRDLNPQPVDYKSTALPVELRWPAIHVSKTSNYNNVPTPRKTELQKFRRLPSAAFLLAPRADEGCRPLANCPGSRSGQPVSRL
jgi:hypothetical protein